MNQPLPIYFTKMHALGNDFVVINTLTQNTKAITHLPIVQLADRHSGIGFDQLLIIESSKRADFYCRIYNADGHEALQCGNGLRCVARELHEQKLCQNLLSLETKAGIFPIDIKNYQEIRIELGVPTIKQQQFKLNPDLTLSLISLGNPHAILKVNSLADQDAILKGKYIFQHSAFKEGINVGLMEIIDSNHIALRTIERGVGETDACGSNAAAAVCAGIVNGWLDNGHSIEVKFKRGSLMIDWQDPQQALSMIGPANRVFSGNFESFK